VLVDEVHMSDTDKYNENCQKNHHEFVQGVQVHTHIHTCMQVHYSALHCTEVYHRKQLLYATQ
jgi:hypothetical protein